MKPFRQQSMTIATIAIVGAVLLALLPASWLHLGSTGPGLVTLYAFFALAILVSGHVVSRLLVSTSPLGQLLAATVLRVTLVLSLVVYAWKYDSPYAQPEHVMYIGAFYFAILGVEVHQAMRQLEKVAPPEMQPNEADLRENRVGQVDMTPELS